MSENQLKPFEKISNSLRSDSEIFSNNADFPELRVTTLPANAFPRKESPADPEGLNLAAVWLLGWLVTCEFAFVLKCFCWLLL